MMEYEGGYILPHLADYLKIDTEGNVIHGKVGGKLEHITVEEAAKRVMYNFFEENAWNIEGLSVISENPRTPSEIAMEHFAEKIGIEHLEDALRWCQEMSYRVIQTKKNFFENLLLNTNTIQIGSQVR